MNTVELLDKAVAGDEAALLALLEEASPPLHAEIAGRIDPKYRSMVDSDDILQVTCLEAFLRIRAFVPAGMGSFVAWLHRIAENNLCDAIKELERDKRPPVRRRLDLPAGDDSYVALVDGLAATTTTPSRVCARDELRQGVEAAMRQLPPDYEQVLRLYELEGLSGEEVAERMGRRHGAVRMMVTRARARLGEILSSSSLFASRA